MNITHDRAKLPKWAQDEMRTQDIRANEYRAAISKEAYVPRYKGDEARVFLSVVSIDGRSHEKAIGGNYAQVIFRTPTDEVEVRVAERNGEIIIEAQAGGLTILPRASNLAQLKGTARW